MALELQPDLIVSDNRMPNLWGSEALRQLAPMLPKAKLILLSGDDPSQLNLPERVMFVGKDQDDFLEQIEQQVLEILKAE